MTRNDTTDRKPGRARSRRSRPLTLIQEVLFVTTVFAVGGVLQILLFLHVGGILE
ncbi:MAG TPA: hypothetical protein VMQ73_05370 [Methylomirabilota bacterium]|nr:hypothetical protein [Methylomirabilota bacterium]